jgi:hypothetical protein
MLSVSENPTSHQQYLQQIVNLFVVDLQERAVNIEIVALLGFMRVYLFEKSKNCSGNKACIIFIRKQVLKKGVLMLLLLNVFRDSVFPIAAKHSVSFSRASLSIGKNCEIVALRYFGEVVSEEIEDVSLRLVFADGLIEFCFDN